MASLLEKRRYIGAEINKEYYEVTIQRLKDTEKGIVKVRDDKPSHIPNINTKVAMKPKHFA